METNIKSPELKLTCNQQLVYDKLVKFIKSKNINNELLLIGYAGTGKTTLVTKFINDMITNKICNNIAIAAPTHKAVNIAKSKLFNANINISSKIDIMTIHSRAGKFVKDYKVNEDVLWDMFNDIPYRKE